MPEAKAKIGVIGGSGLYKIEELKNVEEMEIDTPFGKPSDIIVTGTLYDVGIAFLPRHGEVHRLSPSEVPYRANIYAMKSLGVEHIIAVCSAGSFKKEVAPGHLLIPDQVIDRTRTRISTFFGEGLVGPVSCGPEFIYDLVGVSNRFHQSSRPPWCDVSWEGTSAPEDRWSGPDPWSRPLRSELSE